MGMFDQLPENLRSVLLNYAQRFAPAPQAQGQADMSNAAQEMPPFGSLLPQTSAQAPQLQAPQPGPDPQGPFVDPRMGTVYGGPQYLDQFARDVPSDYKPENNELPRIEHTLGGMLLHMLTRKR